MDAVAFLKTIRQMCRQGCCNDCPWWASCDGHILNHKNLSDSGIEKIVKTAENWDIFVNGTGKFMEF